MNIPEHSRSRSFMNVQDHSWSFVIVRDRSWSFVVVQSILFIFLIECQFIFANTAKCRNYENVLHATWILFMINSTRAFDWFLNCHLWLRKSFGSFCRLMATLTKKKSQIFSHPDMRIHRALVELIRNMLFLIFFLQWFLA